MIEEYCSFCGKSNLDVKVIVKAAGVCICDECIKLAQECVDEYLAKEEIK